MNNGKMPCVAQLGNMYGRQSQELGHAVVMTKLECSKGNMANPSQVAAQGIMICKQDTMVPPTVLGTNASNTALTTHDNKAAAAHKAA